ncbi:MAG: hypothetical protein HY615_08505 [Candidatus Rokubacteria bacterium]|nr:hypothetical protein [Candidatus Rokubacteria bacterium]
MERHLFIVASDQPDLHEYLAREFAAEGNVEVVLDRRASRDRRTGYDRRLAPRALAGRTERRRMERRLRQFVHRQLRSLGYAMLRIG